MAASRSVLDQLDDEDDLFDEEDNEKREEEYNEKSEEEYNEKSEEDEEEEEDDENGIFEQKSKKSKKEEIEPEILIYRDAREYLVEQEAEMNINNFNRISQDLDDILAGMDTNKNIGKFDPEKERKRARRHYINNYMKRLIRLEINNLLERDRIAQEEQDERHERRRRASKREKDKK
jgi:hypothetical protein